MNVQWNRSSAFQFLETRWQLYDGFWACLGELNHFNNVGQFTHRYSPDTARELWSVGLIIDLLLDLELNDSIKSKLIELTKSAFNSEGLCVSFSQPCPLPPDVDATALCTSILLRANQMDTGLLNQIANSLALNINQEKIIKVWFTSSGPFSDVMDIAIALSGLYLLYLLKAEHLAKPTEDFIFDALINNTCQNYFVYYATEEQLLYMLSRIVLLSDSFKKRFYPVLEKRIKQGIGKTQAPLSLAQRMIAATNLGIPNEVDAIHLSLLQNADGSWNDDIIFQYTQPDGITYAHGSKEITTAFAIKALSIY